MRSRPTKAAPRSQRNQKNTKLNSAAQFQQLIDQASVIQHYSLRLYVTGTTHRSTQAVANIRSLCEEYLAGRYDLEVVDIYQQPAEAMDKQIIAAPTLIKNLPMPLKRLVGDLSDRRKVILGLDLTLRETGHEDQNKTKRT
jgi:circadian clock protein KaiB